MKNCLYSVKRFFATIKISFIENVKSFAIKENDENVENGIVNTEKEKIVLTVRRALSLMLLMLLDLEPQAEPDPIMTTNLTLRLSYSRMLIITTPIMNLITLLKIWIK
jgi:hypothetical protein